MKKSLLAASSLAFIACTMHGTEDEGFTESALGTDPSIPALPSPAGTGALAPWGGSDASKWRPEATLANAASAALNDAWSRRDVADALVAMPIRMIPSTFFEFGDGQANAAPSFEGWRTTSRPPVVATLVKFRDGSAKVVLRFDRTLPYGGTAFEIRYNRTIVPLTATRTPEGDATLEWTLPSDLSWNNLLSSQSALVHPVGWGDWFPLWFRMPVKRISDLRASSTRFSDGRTVIDRERVTSVGATDGKTALARLQSHSFGARYNSGQTGVIAPYAPTSIHAIFPFFGVRYVTGVGRGWTWVADERPNGLKVMYTCFEKRRAADEAAAPNGGVASGGGWHQINDAAETILNDLEAGPLPVASAQANVWLASDLPSGGFAYNLTDVMTVRWLRPGEAFITARGGWTNDGRGRWFDQTNYHWYFMPGERDVCTEEIVSSTVPVSFDL